MDRAAPSVEHMTAISPAAAATSPATAATSRAARTGSGFARYRQAITVPGALQFAIPGVIGRFPMAMLSLSQVLLVVAVTGQYGLAGAVSATGSAVAAVTGPRVASLADRRGQARVLRPLVLLFAAATAALAVCAVSRAPTWTLFVAGGLSRGTMPALGSMVRRRWSSLLSDPGLVDAAFSLEGIADELIFIAGPVLVVALVTRFPPVTGLLVTGALSVAGVAGLARHRRSEPPAVPAARGGAGALRSRGLRVLIGMHVCLGAMFVAVDLATIAFASEHGAEPMAGPVLGLYGLGSAAAGVWYGTRRWRAPHSSRLLPALAATVLGVAPLGFMPGIWWLAPAMLVAGLGIAATLASSYRVAEQVVPAARRTEGMSWLTTAASAGTALGAPVAGHLIDSHGALAGYLFGFAVGLVGVALTAAGKRALAGGRGSAEEEPERAPEHGPAPQRVLEGGQEHGLERRPEDGPERGQERGPERGGYGAAAAVPGSARPHCAAGLALPESAGAEHRRGRAGRDRRGTRRPVLVPGAGLPAAGRRFRRLGAGARAAGERPRNPARAAAQRPAAGRVSAPAPGPARAGCR